MSKEATTRNGTRPRNQNTLVSSESAPRCRRMSRRVIPQSRPSTPDTRHSSLWRTLCSSKTVAGGHPYLQTLSQQDWEFLFQQTLLFAHYQVQRLRWRGAHGGVMPDGYDANSLAAEAFLDFFLSPGRDPRIARAPDHSRRTQIRFSGGPHVNRLADDSPSPGAADEVSVENESDLCGSEGEPVSNSFIPVQEATFHSAETGNSSLALIRIKRSCSLSSGERVGVRASSSSDLSAILYELKRLVLKNVTRLHHRKENLILSNAEDLTPVQIEDEVRNPIELIPGDPIYHPDSVLLEKEALAGFEASKSRFSAFLKRERRLRNFFHLLCDRVEKPRDAAAKLKLRRSAGTNLQKQLRRRWRLCFESSAP